MKALKLKPLSLRAPWTKKSPMTGEPDCLCGFCGGVIGVPEDDPRLENHDPDCIGCGLCDEPVRFWRGNGKGTEEIRFHPKCFELCIDRE
jgi:hypothetical protein